MWQNNEKCMKFKSEKMIEKTDIQTLMKLKCDKMIKKRKIYTQTLMKLNVKIIQPYTQTLVKLKSHKIMKNLHTNSYKTQK